MENRCVMCGEIIPEGAQVCPNCRQKKAYKMTTRIYTPNERKRGARVLRSIAGDCLENAGLVIPHGGMAIVDCTCEVRVGDLVHCDNAVGTIHGFIKQVKEIGDTIIVGTNYLDPERNFSFEASVIFGVVTEVFDKFNGRQIYRRANP